MIPAMKRTVKRLIPRRLCIGRLRAQAGEAVLLTFDDGPHPQTTEAVLERLKMYGARAIFFIVGSRICRAPDMLCRIVDEGHWLGNHTYTHPNHGRFRYREYLNDLVKCQDTILRYAPFSPRFHRPPGGKLSTSTLLAPRRLGLTTLTWSYSSEDWRIRAEDVAIARAKEMASNVRPRDILLLHDERRYVLSVLDYLLPRLESRGLNLSPSLEHIL